MKHEFVTHIPDQIDDGTLYVSIEFDTAIHRCACGCGQEVVTPLSPAEWSLTYDGRSVSLSPSIGNWAFPCKSHYWIRRGKVEWGTKFSREKIEAVRARDKVDRERLYSLEPEILLSNRKPDEPAAATTEKQDKSNRRGLLARIFDYFS